MPDQTSLIEQINPYIAAGSAISNPLMAHFTNVKNRKFTREMYKTQRQDALSDWEKQNAYNSPAAQMARFKAAGLNPHLIYGQGNEAQQVRSSSSSGGQAEAPRFDNPLPEMINLQRTQNQSDLVAIDQEYRKEQIKLLQLQQAATVANTGKTGAEIQKIMQDLGITSELRQFTIAGAAAGVQKTLADTKYTLDQNIRSAELHPGNLTQQQVSIKKDLMGMAQMQAQTARTAAEISEINQKVLLLQKENIIKAFDVELTKKGIRPGDPAYQRWIKETFNQVIGEGKQAVEAIKKGKTIIPRRTDTKHFRATDSQ